MPRTQRLSSKRSLSKCTFHVLTSPRISQWSLTDSRHWTRRCCHQDLWSLRRESLRFVDVRECVASVSESVGEWRYTVHRCARWWWHSWIQIKLERLFRSCTFSGFWTGLDGECRCARIRGGSRQNRLESSYSRRILNPLRSKAASWPESKTDSDIPDDPKTAENVTPTHVCTRICWVHCLSLIDGLTSLFRISALRNIAKFWIAILTLRYTHIKVTANGW